MAMTGDPVLAVNDLHVSFSTRAGVVHALSGIDVAVPTGTLLTVIGESGSGKSVLAHAVLGLLPGNATVSGSVRLNGEDLLRVCPRRLRRLCAQELALVPQDPGAALNPVRKLRRTLLESAAVKGVPRAHRIERLTQVTS